MPFVFSDLPDEVIRLCIGSEVLKPQDLAAVLLVSRRLHVLAKTAPVQLHLNESTQSGPFSRQLFLGACCSFPGVVSLNCSGCPLEDADIGQLVRALQFLQKLNLSGCKKLTRSVSKILFPQLQSVNEEYRVSVSDTTDSDYFLLRGCRPAQWTEGSRGLKTVMVQRCFQLTPQALTDALLASMPGYQLLDGVALSHLDLRGWPDAPLSLVIISQLVNKKGGQSGVAGPVNKQHQEDSGEAVANVMQQLCICDDQGPFQHACHSSTWMLAATSKLEDPISPSTKYLGALSPKGLRVLALHNCGGLSIGALQIIARCCPSLEALFLGGSSLALQEAPAAGNSPVDGSHVFQHAGHLHSGLEADLASRPAAVVPANGHIGAPVQLAMGQVMPDEFMDCNGNMRSVSFIRTSAAETLAGLRFARYADPVVLAAAVEFATLAALLPRLVVLELSFALPGLVSLLQQLHERQEAAPAGAGHLVEQLESHQVRSMHSISPCVNSPPMFHEAHLPGVHCLPGRKADTHSLTTGWDQLMRSVGGPFRGGEPRPPPQFWDLCQPHSVQQALGWFRQLSNSLGSFGGQTSVGASEASAFLRAAASCSSGAKVTPLHTAAEEGRCDMAQGLLRLGADVLARDRSGASPLFRACELGHTSAAQLLLRAGADATRRNSAGEAPLYIAALRGHDRVVQLLLEHCAHAGISWEDPGMYGDGWTPLMAAAVGGRTAIARRLLSTAGAAQAAGMVRATNRYGQTAVHIAARRGSWDLLQCLIEAGGGAAVAKLVDCNGSTAADIARRSGNAAAWELLRVFGEGDSLSGSGCPKGRRGRRERKAAQAGAVAAASSRSLPAPGTSSRTLLGGAQAAGLPDQRVHAASAAGQACFSACGAEGFEWSHATRDAAGGDHEQGGSSAAERQGDTRQWVGRRLEARKSEASHLSACPRPT